MYIFQKPSAFQEDTGKCIIKVIELGSSQKGIQILIHDKYISYLKMFFFFSRKFFTIHFELIN